jgi:hypothetical protein
LPATGFGAGRFEPCPYCGAELQLEIFPALFRPVERGKTAQAIVIEGTSACFYHPQRQAAIPCDGCGRFLCALCDIELVPGEHLCANCIEAGRSKGKIATLEQGRTRYDSLALTLALLPFTIILWFTVFVTVPAAIFFAILSLRRPGGIVGGSRARAVWALLIACATLIGGGVGLYFIWNGAKHVRL